MSIVLAIKIHCDFRSEVVGTYPFLFIRSEFIIPLKIDVKYICLILQKMYKPLFYKKALLLNQYLND